MNQNHEDNLSETVSANNETVQKDEEKVYNPRDIIDGKFLEDYFYNS